jgi:hypothetical protein
MGVHGETRVEGVISKRRWAQKVMLIANVLGINLRSIKDFMHHKVPSTVPGTAGLMEASHNEKKLAVYAVYRVYASAEKISFRDAIKKRLTRRDLARLQGFRLRDGSRPRFAITLRPPNVIQRACQKCRSFVDRLSRVTGIKFSIRPVELRSSELITPTHECGPGIPGSRLAGELDQACDLGSIGAV